MPWTDIVVIGAGFLLSFGGGVVGGALIQLLANRSVLARLESVENREKGARGRESQSKMEEETSAAIGEVIAGVQAGADIKEVVKGVAFKHPMVAMKFAKELGVLK